MFLLKKIAGYKENGFETLGHLNARHVKDIAGVMMNFAEESIAETIELLNKGESVNVNGKLYSLKKIKRK